MHFFPAGQKKRVFFILVPIGLTVLAALVLHVSFLPAQNADFQQCYECHGQILQDQMSRMVVHVPFMEQNCRVCHMAQPKAAAQDAQKAKQDKPKKIQWLGESLEPDGRHLFLVPGRGMENSLIVEVRKPGGVVSREEILVPAHEVQEPFKDMAQAPVVADVQMLGVERGLFLTATIRWTTNTPSEGRVYYGESELVQRSPLTRRLGYTHQVVLRDLKPGKNYQFQVEATDLFGRSTRATPQSFSTAKPRPATRPADIPSTAQVATTATFQRFGDDYLVDLSISQPAVVSIGAYEPTDKLTQNQLSAEGESARPDAFHAGLSDQITVSMHVCNDCHQRQVTASHPVNVLPRPDMIIPPEYPTLPDGRITCMTCHQVHGSDYPYRLIKRGQRELCVGCHVNML